MESETLFAEEAEPPGRGTGNGLQPYDGHVGMSMNILYTPAAVPARPAPMLPVFGDSRARAFRKRFYPNIPTQGMERLALAASQSHPRCGDAGKDDPPVGG